MKRYVVTTGEGTKEHEGFEPLTASQQLDEPGTLVAVVWSPNMRPQMWVLEGKEMPIEQSIANLGRYYDERSPRGHMDMTVDVLTSYAGKVTVTDPEPPELKGIGTDVLPPSIDGAGVADVVTDADKANQPPSIADLASGAGPILSDLDTKPTPTSDAPAASAPAQDPPQS